MHQEWLFLSRGYLSSFTKQKGQDRRWMRDVFVPLRGSLVMCVYVCVHRPECNRYLLSFSKQERSQDAQQAMKGKPGDTGRLLVSNDQGPA